MYNETPVVLYFVKKGKKGNWKTLLNTDLSSNFNKTMEIYQIRWSIEVFFKECKQSLRLGKSQSTDFGRANCRYHNFNDAIPAPIHKKQC